MINIYASNILPSHLSFSDKSRAVFSDKAKKKSILYAIRFPKLAIANFHEEKIRTQKKIASHLKSKVKKRKASKPSSLRLKKIAKPLPTKGSLLDNPRLIALKNSSFFHRKQARFERKLSIQRTKQMKMQKLFRSARNQYSPSELTFTLMAPSWKNVEKVKTFSSPQLNYLASHFYSLFCQKHAYYDCHFNPLPEFVKTDHLAMKTVILPAFFNRGVAFCFPRPSESEKIITSFYVHDFAFNKREKLARLISQQGILKTAHSDHQLIVLYNTSTTPLGVIHFKIKEAASRSFCYIYSLKVAEEDEENPQYRQKGYGSLLLSYAIKVAQDNNCSSIKLKSSEEALGFYFKFGFMADSAELESYDEWMDKDESEKLSLAEDQDHELILELNEDQVQTQIEDCLEKAVSSF
ncbi:GNAT family N-acetyltransferase [Candidatus Protochlamydia phocaeensis]|uniref:GNAT family N-acetyltransferase n=1 Tax=Candidatus Protochlamydia phocaeensis TaxID=1414722 RepID=UPI000838C80E|nr:GNAT family N-acetyltransferase [Candidatus Protochlamydia phocaeensis]